LLKRSIKLVISVLVFCIDYCINQFYRCLKLEAKGKCVILYYHEIHSSQRANFVKQLDILKKYAKPILLSTANLVPNERAFVITFDDGMSSVIENALPELKRRQIPSVIFVPVSYLGKKPSWPGIEEHILKHESVITETDIRELDKSGLIEIGSHCMSHSDLTYMQDEVAEEEITKSKIYLENIINKAVNFISFPHGEHKVCHIKQAKNAGYVKAFSIVPEQVSGSFDKYVIGRVRIDATDWNIEVSLKVLGAYRWLSALFAIKRDNLYRRINEDKRDDVR